MGSRSTISHRNNNLKICFLLNTTKKYITKTTKTYCVFKRYFYFLVGKGFYSGFSITRSIIMPMLTTEQKLDLQQYYVDNPCDTLFKLRRVFHRWFKYSNETLLDMCLALRVHTEWLLKEELTPLWIFIIAPSGDRKSETIRAFEGSGNVYLVNHITKNTLATGWRTQVKNDLAPKLDRQLVLTYDFGQFLKIQSKEKGEVWSQMRSAFDGYVIRQTGSGVSTEYKGLRWDWLIGTTPLIDDELILKDQLGTRELMVRLEDDKVNMEEIQKQVWDNAPKKERMRLELSCAVNSFIKHWKEHKIEYECVEVSEDIKNQIFLLARFISQMRATGSYDHQTGELTTFVEPEKPTRNLEQLRGLFAALKSLSPNYTDELALKRLRVVAKSTINPIRYKILYNVAGRLDFSAVSVSYIRKKLGIGYKTINRELNTLYQLGFVDFKERSDKRREWYIPEGEMDDEQLQIINFVLEGKAYVKKNEEIEEMFEPELTLRDKRIKILTIIGEKTPTIQELINYLKSEINEPDVREIVRLLKGEGCICQPDMMHYQKV